MLLGKFRIVTPTFFFAAWGRSMSTHGETAIKRRGYSG